MTLELAYDFLIAVAAALVWNICVACRDGIWLFIMIENIASLCISLSIMLAILQVADVVIYYSRLQALFAFGM